MTIQPNVVEENARNRTLRALAGNAVNFLEKLDERSYDCCECRNRIPHPLHCTNKLLQLRTGRWGVHVLDTVDATWVEANNF